MPTNSHPKLVGFGSVIATLLIIIPVAGHSQGISNAWGPNSLLSLGSRLGVPTSVLDSSIREDGQASDSLRTSWNLKSPLLAVAFSVVPGGGQLYNGSYWKAPIVWGVQAYFVSQWIINNKDYRFYRSEYSNSITSLNPDGNATLRSLRDAYLDQRDSFAWYIAGTYLLSMLDAYVDAELSGFDVSPNLSATPAGTTVAVSFRMKF